MVDVLKSLVAILVTVMVVMATVFASLTINTLFFAAVIAFVDFIAGTAFFSWTVAAVLSLVWMVIK